MRVLLLGASGFIGQRIVANVPDHIELTGTYFQNKMNSNHCCVEQLDCLDEGLDWPSIVTQYSCIVVSARANAGNKAERDLVSIRSKKAYRNMLDAVKESPNKPFIVALNGSLSYGHHGEQLVTTGDEVRPTGFATSYSMAEQPFREDLSEGSGIAIVRAPWVLGLGSWFSQMYLKPGKVPIVGRGRQWMSVVTVDGLAAFVWQLVKRQTPGVYHPKLICRCRQKDFARAVNEVTKKPITRLGWFGLRTSESQMRESILASIRLDDGEGQKSEGQPALDELKTAIGAIYSGFS